MTAAIIRKKIIGCVSVDGKGDKHRQYCVNCDLPRKYRDSPRTFEQKCESLRFSLDAYVIYNGGDRKEISPESKRTRERIEAVKFDGDIDEYAKALYELTERKVTEAEAEELEAAGLAVRVCPVNGGRPA